MRRAAVGAALAVAVGALLTGCTSNTPAERSAEPEASASPSSGVTFAAIGDSISDADSPDFAAGRFGPASWASAATAEGLAFAGGWAEWGATTAQMAAAAPAVDADVLIVLAGTNDVALGIPFAESAANLDRIVEAVGVDEVAVVSIPPLDLDPAGVESYNAELSELADDRGWRFLDASAGLRTDEGRFREGMTVDGAHPTAEGARVLGEAIAAGVLSGKTGG
ncbi:GDSL-type esterase/lipase family protein [Agromyces seonyuensis]|uniref:SGNH hydrolase-type esterase domain-containing protein n=1 Tax=Agromyces seonyuensis TaxID=2662446 RepID=A0A6I4NWM5_9MICO|nr:hypothetical protein [Agromyces seonyuensis]